MLRASSAPQMPEEGAECWRVAAEREEEVGQIVNRKWYSRGGRACDGLVTRWE